MVLFPIALLWLIGVIVWVVRNEGAKPESDRARWTRWIPRAPRRSGPGTPGVSRRELRRGAKRRAASGRRASSRR